jgi:Arc/MetJ-type ribon-helix-helix transcriptional regulator
MPIQLTPESEAFIAEEISRGIYHSRVEALEASVNVLRHRRSLVVKLGRNQFSTEDLSRSELSNDEKMVLLCALL